MQLITHPPNINKTYLYAKDPYEPKYQLLPQKREEAYIKHIAILEL